MKSRRWCWCRVQFSIDCVQFVEWTDEGTSKRLGGDLWTISIDLKYLLVEKRFWALQLWVVSAGLMMGGEREEGKRKEINLNYYLSICAKIPPSASRRCRRCAVQTQNFFNWFLISFFLDFSCCIARNRVVNFHSIPFTLPPTQATTLDAGSFEQLEIVIFNSRMFISFNFNRDSFSMLENELMDIFFSVWIQFFIIIFFFLSNFNLLQFDWRLREKKMPHRWLLCAARWMRGDLWAPSRSSGARANDYIRAELWYMMMRVENSEKKAIECQVCRW